MTVITGRRRIGKTSLALRATQGAHPTVYLFVSRKNEAALCEEFVGLIVSALDCYVPSDIKSFKSLFRMLMELARTRRFNLIIDGFQEFFNINQSVYSEMQNIWDAYRNDTHVNLLLMGSVYSMMHKIFENYHEPLFGRADAMICLSGFGTGTMKEIMHDFRPDYTNDELLALYTITGGVPKYIELLCEDKDLSVEGMVPVQGNTVPHMQEHTMTPTRGTEQFKITTDPDNATLYLALPENRCGDFRVLSLSLYNAATEFFMIGGEEKFHIGTTWVIIQFPWSDDKRFLEDPVLEVWPDDDRENILGGN